MNRLKILTLNSIAHDIMLRTLSVNVLVDPNRNYEVNLDGELYKPVRADKSLIDVYAPIARNTEVGEVTSHHRFWFIIRNECKEFLITPLVHGMGYHAVKII